jgi:hypothetical protein
VVAAVVVVPVVVVPVVVVSPDVVVPVVPVPELPPHAQATPTPAPRARTSELPPTAIRLLSAFCTCFSFRGVCAFTRETGWASPA